MERQAISEIVMKCILEVIPDLDGSKLSGLEQFEDIGANSADRADIVALALEALLLDIPRVSAFGPKTINGLIDLLHEKYVEV